MFAPTLFVVVLGLCQSLPGPSPTGWAEDWEIERDMAKARFDVTRSSLKELQERRLAAIEEARRQTLVEFEAGRATLDTVLAVEELVLRAAKPPTLLPVGDVVIERTWRSRYTTFRLTQAKLEAGKISPADLSISEQALIEIEIQLVLRAKKSP